MPRRKKGGSGGLVGVFLIAIIVTVASIPKEAWATLTIIMTIGGLYYLFKKPKASAVEPASAVASQQATRSDRSWLTSAGTANDEDVVPVEYLRPETPKSFRIPPAPANKAGARWIPAQENVAVSGIDIPGGLLYVGVSLLTPSIFFHSKRNEW